MVCIWPKQISVHSPEELSTRILDSKLKFEVNTKEKDWVDFLFSVVEMDDEPAFRAATLVDRNCRYLHETPRTDIHTYPVRLMQQTVDLLLAIYFPSGNKSS